MGHSISGMVIRGPVVAEAVTRYDTSAVALRQGMFLLWMNHEYTEYWARYLNDDGWLELPDSVPDSLQGPMLLPRERVVAHLARDFSGVTPPLFAVLTTDYFGGVGSQVAVAYRGTEPIATDGSINQALRALGVGTRRGLDEFDSVGLGQYRSIPDPVLERWQRYDV